MSPKQCKASDVLLQVVLLSLSNRAQGTATETGYRNPSVTSSRFLVAKEDFRQENNPRERMQHRYGDNLPYDRPVRRIASTS